MAEQVPFSAEYAKSGRSGCKKCGDSIAQGSLRIAVMVQSPHFDGQMPLWHHSHCFWAKNKAKAKGMAEGDFKGLASLRWEDQESIRKAIAGEALPEGALKTGGKENAPEFALDYAKSARSACRGCGEKIAKAELRISVKDVERGRKIDAWHHLKCFADSPAAEDLPSDQSQVKGWDSLTEEDRKTLEDLVKTSSLKRKGSEEAEEKTAKKKAKKAPTEAEDPLKKALKEESQGLWKVRDSLGQMGKREWEALLTHNGQEIPSGESRILDRLSDMIYFGVLEPCSECGQGQLVFSTSVAGYRCQGNLSEWSKCSAVAKEPKRRPLKVPAELGDYAWLKKWGGAPTKTRHFNEAAASSQTSSAAAAIAQAVDRRYAARSGKSTGSGKSYKSEAKSVKMKVKGGAAVDEACEVADKVHVWRDESGRGTAALPWAATLNSVDVLRGSNSYYKLQLLQHDKKPGKFYVFRSWGRLGTTIGGAKTESMGSLSEAKEHFAGLYLDKTGNLWEDRGVFQKRPGKMFPVDVDYGEAEAQSSALVPGSRSKLPSPVQELMKLIFDIQAMKDTMLEFEIDLAKMPLGKISKAQISSAYAVLSEMQTLLEGGGSVSQAKAVDASNRFFTLIPHDFGMEKPPLLDSPELIKTKASMLDSLLELEVAYSILKGSSEDAEVDPIDAQYGRLNCGLRPIAKDSEEFALLVKYVANTHAATHNLYKLRVDEIFAVERDGEAKAFNPKGLHNRQLLWHGSRTSNYAGILAQGLRIAPPEAPVTGYMFGKGVYFADMVSKSANYCHAPRDGPGLLLLADVALGDMWELRGAKPVTKAMISAQKKHSTKGLGRTAPKAKSDFLREDGVKLPMGKGADSGVNDTSLLYNEYIVYDTNQINLKYLLRTTFLYD